MNKTLPATIGTVLVRTPDGWAPVAPASPADAVAAPAEDAGHGSLEDQARAWDRVCERARTVAALMAEQYADEPEVTGVSADRDTVFVSLHIADAARRAAWMQALGLTDGQLAPAGDYGVVGQTTWDEVPLSVVAYTVPAVQAGALASAKLPYVLDGVVYDLTLPQKDSEGDVWFYQDDVWLEGVPLMRLDGRPERCTLANIIRLVGPLTPVRDPLDAGSIGGAR